MAQISEGERASTLYSSPTLSNVFDCTLHDCPFHRSMSPELMLPVGYAYPTAHTSWDEIAATASSRLSEVPGFGLGTRLHCVPSQCSISVIYEDGLEQHW